ncbi:MAG: YjfB family protein [Selenomonas sp.]|nr:YjfB family protein [Selenomonas sp.]
MDMSIAALSVGMHQNQASQDMGVAVLKMAMDNTGTETTQMLDQMTESLDPNLGSMLDIQA